MSSNAYSPPTAPTTPPTRTRHELATAVPPTPTPRRRCEIPHWFTDLHHTARAELADARAAHAAEQTRDVDLQHRIDQLTRQLTDLVPRCAPHDNAIGRVTDDLREVQQRHRHAERELAESGRLHRRTARHTVADCADAVAIGKTALGEITRRAQPLLDQRDQLRTERHQLEQQLRIDRELAHSLDRYDNGLATARQRLDALDTWTDWANGHTPRPAALINAAHHLHHTGGHHTLLAEPLTASIHEHDLAPARPTPAQHEVTHYAPRPEPPGLDIGM